MNHKNHIFIFEHPLCICVQHNMHMWSEMVVPLFNRSVDNVMFKVKPSFSLVKSRCRFYFWHEHMLSSVIINLWLQWLLVGLAAAEALQEWYQRKERTWSWREENWWTISSIGNVLSWNIINTALLTATMTNKIALEVFGNRLRQIPHRLQWGHPHVLRLRSKYEIN